MNFLTLLKLFGRPAIVQAIRKVIVRRFTKQSYDLLHGYLAQGATACEQLDGAALAEAITDVVLSFK